MGHSCIPPLFPCSLLFLVLCDLEHLLEQLEEQSCFGVEYWAMKRHVDKISVAEMMILKWMSGKTRKGMIRNNDIRGNLRVATI